MCRRNWKDFIVVIKFEKQERIEKGSWFKIEETILKILKGEKDKKSIFDESCWEKGEWITPLEKSGRRRAVKKPEQSYQSSDSYKEQSSIHQQQKGECEYIH